MSNKIKLILAIIILIIGLIFGIWLSCYVMLFGGIMQAYYGFNNGDPALGTCGIMRALFFEAGMIPTYITWMAACLLVNDD